jgi:hypothetical protein
LSISGGDQAAIIGVGSAVVLVLAGGLVKAASLRGDMNQKWSSRIDLAAVALDEKTVFELKQLRDEIDTVMPADDALFEPGQAIADPSPLSARVEKTAKFYRARVRMEKDLRRLVGLGRVAVGALTGLIIAVLFLTLHYAELSGWRWMRWAGFGLGTVATVILIAVGLVYTVCVDQLSSSEILAESASQAGTGSNPP